MKNRPLLFAKFIVPPCAGLSFAAAAALASGQRLDSFGLIACLFGITAAYCLDNFFDTQKMNSPGHSAILLGCIMTCGFILLAAVYFDRRLIAPVALLSFLALFYIPLKRLFLKNLLTALAWVVAVTILPIKGYSFSISFSLTAAIFCIVLSNTLLCDVVDIASDRRHAVPSLAAFSSPRFAVLVSLLAASTGLIFALIAGRKSAPFAIDAGIYIAISVARFFNIEKTQEKLSIDVWLLAPGLLAMAIL